MINFILRLLGFIKCNSCGDIIHKFVSTKRNFRDKENDPSYPARICKICKYYYDKELEPISWIK